MEQWTVSQTAFEHLLEVLDTDRELAGEKYEELRHRIIKFFEWRACSTPEDLADRTLDRLARKLSSGEQINDHINYAYGVARFIFLEDRKQTRREDPLQTDIAWESVVDEDFEMRMSCLESCLDKLPENSRRMILGYYREDRKAKIDHRKKIADELGITVNALRIKSLRIRAKLEECVLRSIKNMTGNVKHNARIYH